MKIRIDPTSYSRKFHNIIHSWDRYIIAYGGRGSGKSDSFYLKYLVELFEPYHFRLAYINKEKANIRDQQYAGFKRVAKRVGLYDHLQFYDGDYRVVCPTTGNALIPKGMDDPEKTKGLDDITAIWWDEANKGTLDDFRALNELLRSPEAQYLQFALSFNPTYEQHWLRHTFFDPDDRHRVHPSYKGKLLLNRSTYLDNDFLDKKAYYQTLLDSAAGNRNIIRVNVEGDWGIDENGNPWLYNFNYDTHTRGDIPFFPRLPVYISFDFNNDPFAATAWQFSEEKGTRTSFIHCINEFSGMVKIEDMCSRIRSAYPSSLLFVTGDRSGSNEDIGRNQTLYQMIAGLLRVPDRRLNLNSSNLTHADSRVLLNTMLHHYPHLYIDRRCVNLIRQCQAATVDQKTDKAGKLLKDREGHKNDEFDSMRYFFQTYFNDFCKRVYTQVLYSR